MTGRLNHSHIGRLLQEISWEGRKVVGNYRDGGLGIENVLTAEVIQGLDFLPRAAFLGGTLRTFKSIGEHCKEKLDLLVDQSEAFKISLLPYKDYLLAPSRNTLSVQPDAVFESERVLALVEAKRIGSSIFGEQQLAREFVLVTRECGSRRPVLLLILDSPPPVKVHRRGLMHIAEAIRSQLSDVLALTENHPLQLSELDALIDESVFWTTWHDIQSSLEQASATFTNPDKSVIDSVNRIANSTANCITLNRVRHEV